MDDVEHIPGGEQPESHFASRLARACGLVGLSVAVHVWGLPAVQGTLLRLPAAPARLVVREQPPRRELAPAAGARVVAIEPAASVQVRTQLIALSEPAPPLADRHRTLLQPDDRRASDADDRPASDADDRRAARERGRDEARPPDQPVGTAGTNNGPGRRPDTVAGSFALAHAPASPLDLPMSAPDTATPSPAPPTIPAPAMASSLPLAAGPAVAAAADRPRRDEEIVRELLREYAQAFERLDVQAAKAIWPTVDERGLQRAFQRLDGQELHFESCGVAVSGHDANARCRGNATYRPKVGSRVLRLTAREWTFNLSRDNDRWQIVNATLQ